MVNYIYIYSPLVITCLTLYVSFLLFRSPSFYVHCVHIYICYMSIVLAHSSVCFWIKCSVHYWQLHSLSYTEVQAFNSRDEQYKAVLSWAELALAKKWVWINLGISDDMQLASKVHHLAWSSHQHQMLSTIRIYSRVWDCEFRYGSGSDETVQFSFANFSFSDLFSFFSSLRRCIWRRNINVTVTRVL